MVSILKLVPSIALLYQHDLKGDVDCDAQILLICMHSNRACGLGLVASLGRIVFMPISDTIPGNDRFDLIDY